LLLHAFCSLYLGLFTSPLHVGGGSGLPSTLLLAQRLHRFPCRHRHRNNRQRKKRLHMTFHKDRNRYSPSYSADAFALTSFAKPTTIVCVHQLFTAVCHTHRHTETKLQS